MSQGLGGRENCRGVVVTNIFPEGQWVEEGRTGYIGMDQTPGRSDGQAHGFHLTHERGRQ